MTCASTFLSSNDSVIHDHPCSKHSMAGANLNRIKKVLTFIINRFRADGGEPRNGDGLHGGVSGDGVAGLKVGGGQGCKRAEGKGEEGGN